ncbi:MAG: hypothetical protein ABIF92_02425, partial [archaeon]
WKAPQSFEGTKQISVVKKTVISDDSTPAESTGTGDSQITDDKITDLDKSKTSAGMSTAKKYLFALGLLIVAIIGVVFFLEKRGRYI